MTVVTILIALAVVVAAVYGIRQMAGGRRYSEMTEEEFEEDAKRVSGVRGAMLEVQKLVDPARKVEYVQQADKKVEGQRQESAGSKDAGHKKDRNNVAP